MINPDGSVQGVWFRRTSRDRFADVHKALMEPCGRLARVPPGMITRLVIARTEDEVQAALAAQPAPCGWVRLTDGYRGETQHKEGHQMSLLHAIWHRMREGINVARARPAWELEHDVFTFLYDSRRSTGLAEEHGLRASEGR